MAYMGQRRGVVALLLLGLVFGLGLAACSDDAPKSAVQSSAGDVSEDAGGEPDVAVEDEPEADVGPDVPDWGDVELPPVIVAVDTLLTSNVVTAGSTVDARCQFIDEMGEAVELEEPPAVFINHAPSESFAQGEDGLIATRVGAATFTCSAPSLSLIDQTPAELTILHGPPDTVLTEVDRNLIVAGDEVVVGCSVFDAWGNAIDDVEPTVRVDPSGDGVEVLRAIVTLERTGIFTVSCQLDGAGDVIAEVVEVIPALPAHLVVSKDPDQRVYGLGAVVGLIWTVTDRYGNIIRDPVLDIGVAPPAEYFGEGRYRFDNEGTYVMSVRVSGRTENNIPLQAGETVVINGSGPSITCDNPRDAALIDTAPGPGFIFRGRVADANGVSEVRVNGNPVVADADGRFAVTLTTRFGINFVDISALDDFGEENATTCAFLVADNWAPENGFLDDGVTLRLAQSGVDDGNRGDGCSNGVCLDSLNDVLHIVVNSTGLVDQLRNTLEGADPLKASSCHQRVFGLCVLSSEVWHEDSKIDGPNSTSLTLLDGGMRAVASLRGLGVRVRVKGKVAGIGYDTTGWVTMNTASVDVTFNLELRNGQPRVTVRSVNDVAVSNVDTSFNGLDGFIINVVVDLFQGTIRNLIRDTLRDQIRNAFDDILDGLVSNLDISTLGTSFNVPRLSGGDPIRMGFGVRFSTVTVNGTRALFGIGTRMTAPITHGGNTYGAPIPPGTVRRDPTTDRSIASGVNIGVLNQALHTLWRGGLLDADINGATLGGFPAGTQANIRTNLPPVAAGLRGGKVELMLGAMSLDLVYPGVFDRPLSVVLGARAQTAIQLNGDDLAFSNVQITELFFSTPDTTLTAQNRETIEGFLRSLIQSVVDRSLNDALPALPIPAFALPSAVGAFGLPAGADLGIVGPRLDNDESHFVIDGNFGIR